MLKAHCLATLFPAGFAVCSLVLLLGTCAPSVLGTALGSGNAQAGSLFSWLGVLSKDEGMEYKPRDSWGCRKGYSD